MKKYPIENIREQFPALKRSHNGKTAAYFDGPGGSQVVQSAIDAMAGYMTRGGANLGGVFPSSRETESLIAAVKEDVSVLLNAAACKIAFGANATTMMFHVSRALARQWKEGDEIILSELEHHSNVDSWRSAAEDQGVIVKYIPFNPKTLTLDLDALPALLSGKTKLVAVGSASNCIGTITDVKAVSRLAKNVGATVAVDAVHGLPHIYTDMEELGIDILFSSAYKFFAAHVGMAVIRNDVFEKLQVYKLAPAPDTIPAKLEIGTQNYEGIATVSAAVNFIAGLGEGGSLKEKIITGYKAIEAHENSLAEKIRGELAKIKGVTLFQAAADVPKTPTIAFRVAGIAPKDFCEKMCDQYSVFVGCGHFYAVTVAQKLGVLDNGCFIRAGMAPYNTMEEAERFIEGVRAIVG
ncbi:MAG: cysteine desulfurase-like protein [Spirochaetes bacterium]|nr:cysteine desulfurase-like protein [Spirochaetota bacterium]